MTTRAISVSYGVTDRGRWLWSPQTPTRASSRSRTASWLSSQESEERRGVLESRSVGWGLAAYLTRCRMLSRTESAVKKDTHKWQSEGNKKLLGSLIYRLLFLRATARVILLCGHSKKTLSISIENWWKKCKIFLITGGCFRLFITTRPQRVSWGPTILRYSQTSINSKHY